MGYLEIPIAALAAFLLGFAWYTVLFGKAWQAETGVTDEQAQSGIAVTHGTAFLMMNLIAFGMLFLIHMHPIEEQTFTHGAFHGLMVGLTLCLPAVVIHYVYQKKSFKLMAIDGGYLVLFCALIGGVLGALKMFTM